MLEEIGKFSQKIGVPVKKILDVFYYLKDGEKIENYELIRKTGIAKDSLNSIKEYFKDIFMPVSPSTQVNEAKINDLKKMFSKEYAPDEKLLNLGTSINLDDIISKRKTPLRKYDQFTATTETVLKRIALLKHFEDIDHKRILFLGDDDFTSVAVAMGNSDCDITVLDIDSRIIEEISTISEKKGLNIKTVKHDLKKTLPNDLLGSFDVVFTDPPYTSEGIRLFLSRSISLLDSNNNTARIYLCYGNSDRAKERFIPIYRSIIDSGLMIRHIFDKFNRYFGAESIGSSSSLFVLDITPKTRALIKGDYDKPIYTNH